MRRCIVVILLFGLALALSGCGGSKYHTVVYQVTGTSGQVIITFVDRRLAPAGAITSLPWAVTLDLIPSGQYVYVSARNDSGETGEITASILIAGAIIDSETASGEFAVVAAQGSVP
jgi:hypothetical protein